MPWALQRMTVLFILVISLATTLDLPSLAKQHTHDFIVITVCRFCMNWLLLFLIHNMAISLFTALGALARNIVGSQL